MMNCNYFLGFFTNYVLIDKGEARRVTTNCCEKLATTFYLDKRLLKTGIICRCDKHVNYRSLYHCEQISESEAEVFIMLDQ